MDQYGNNDKLLIPSFSLKSNGPPYPDSPEVEISKITLWADVTHMIIEHYNFNIEITADWEAL